MESQTKLSYQQRRRNIMATLALTNFQKQWILQTTQSILQPYDPTMRFPTLHLIPASEKTMQKITASLIASLLCKGKKKRIVMLVPTPYPIVDLVAKTIIDERLLCDEDLVKEKTKMQMTVQIHDTANKNLFTNTLRVITASSRLVKGIGGDVFICLLNGMDASVLQTITKEIIAPQMRIPETRFVFDDASKVMIDNESNESKMDQSKKDEVIIISCLYRVWHSGHSFYFRLKTGVGAAKPRIQSPVDSATCHCANNAYIRCFTARNATLTCMRNVDSAAASVVIQGYAENALCRANGAHCLYVLPVKET